MPHLSLGTVDLYYEITGQGQPLVFIHGLGSSTRDWDDQVAEVSRTYQVITFDLRGHGKSGKPAGPYTLPLLVADTARLLTALGLHSAHLIGISLGGGVAFQFALDFPAMVKTLAIVNSAPAIGGTPQQARQEIDRPVGIVQQLGLRAIGEALSPRLFPKPEHAHLRESFVERWAQNDPSAYIEATRWMLGWKVTDQLNSIRGSPDAACWSAVVAVGARILPIYRMARWVCVKLATSCCSLAARVQSRIRIVW
jgi:pimeloyl-ACP methyl ester carboxylesterase